MWMTRFAIVLLAGSSLALAEPVPRPPDPKIASTVRQAGERPVYEMEQALAMARRHAKDHAIKFGTAYLQGAVFDAVKRDWVFDWQVPNAKGGLTIITVHETGEIVANFGE
jgi:predicted transcriptional regulator